MTVIQPMSGTTMATSDGVAAIEVDESLYPKDAVYGAAYTFIDRCYVHLDRAADQRIRVTLRLKPGVTTELDVLAGDFQNELLAQAWRRRIVEENRGFIEAITTKALAGAAGPPGLDELLAADIGADTAFDDPLGIAMSWEEKYKKKGQSAEPDEPPPAPEGEKA